MEDDEEKEEPAAMSVSKPSPTAPAAQSAIDLTAHFLHPLLNAENVANLVRHPHSHLNSDHYFIYFIANSFILFKLSSATFFG